MVKVSVPRGQKWIAQIFQSKAAKTGGVVRRKIDSVKAYSTIKQLKAAVKSRGFHMLRSGDQYLIFCHTGYFKVIC